MTFDERRVVTVVSACAWPWFGIVHARGRGGQDLTGGGIAMRLSGRGAGVVVAVVVALVSVVAAGAAFGSPGTQRGDAERTLRFHTVLISSAVNDAGHGGPGNVIALLFDVQTPQGSPAGKAHISCTVFTADVQLCHAGFVLADGQIEAQASIPQADTTFAVAIIGGTGAYNGVTGQMRNVRQAPGVVDRTLYLIFPRNR
jgi:hypothetical protein